MTASLQPDDTLIDRLLAEQRDLTAVAKFSRMHDEGLHSRDYRELIPMIRLYQKYYRLRRPETRLKMRHNRAAG